MVQFDLYLRRWRRATGINRTVIERPPLCEIGQQQPTCGVEFRWKVGCLLEVSGLMV
jgi:hypothetical protein